ncbi:aminopeptidase N [Encephalitozoon intestinalis ATCC 50506]|nr:aminopeptidase N [Encephalitozoon intestinalis ATCC 50506]ADM10867.1 aminopeptidase N [Encephalitozoon intestinalis ATCC 50506]
MKWIELAIGLIPMIEGRQEEDSSYRRRLEKIVIPEHYDLHVKVMDVGFCGKVGISVSILEPVREIVMNAKELEIQEATIRVGDTEVPGEIVMGEKEKEYEIVRIVFEKEIEAGKGYITAKFCGDYNNGLVGFYKSGEEKEIYSTHFEPTDARRVFPCFDQPDMKATFQISIDAPSRLVVLSNSPEEEEKREEYGDRAISYFEKTSKMSTYLVAFVIGDLNYIEDWSKGGVRLRVYGQGEEVEWGRYGLEVAKRCIDYFSEYFGIGYEFPRKESAKVDMVGIPSFGSGAMENWGLITFRRESLLYVAGKSSVEDKKNVAETVCHELAHMWFGNLVTMEWWDDLWLNEGFATWMSYKGMENIGDVVDWDVWGEFLLWDVIRGMLDDGLGKSHKIQMAVENAGEIGEIFDTISYSKGSSVIRMIERYVGESVFMLGIRRYIREHMYGNVNGESLWKAIGKEYGKDILPMVEGWISQAGYPMVEVSERESSLMLKQSRYSMIGKGDSSVWTVPVVIEWEGGEKESISFSGKEMEIPRKKEGYKMNAEYGGFYRVKYGLDGLKRLEKRIGEMSSEDRVNMIEDVFGVGFGLYGGLKEGLRKVGEYYSETYHVGRSAIEKLLRIRSVFYDDSEVVSLVEKKIIGLIERRISSVDVWKREGSVEEISMDKYVLSVGIEVGSKVAKEKVMEMWNEHLRSGKELGEFRRIVYEGVVDDNLEYMMEKYWKGDTPGMRREVMFGFGGIQKQENFEKILSSLGKFNVEDIGVVIAVICRGNKFRDAMVEYVVSHGEELCSMVHDNGMLYNIIIMSLRHVSGEAMVSRVVSFLSGIKHPGSQLNIEKVQDEIEWRRRMKGIREEILSGLREEA